MPESLAEWLGRQDRNDEWFARTVVMTQETAASVAGMLEDDPRIPDGFVDLLRRVAEFAIDASALGSRDSG